MVSGLWRDGHGPDHLCLSNAADQMGATEDRALGARAFRRLFCRRVNCLPRLAPAVCRGGRPRGDRGAAARSPTRFGANSLSQFASVISGAGGALAAALVVFAATSITRRSLKKSRDDQP
jgi:hypothetical protein